MKSPRTILSRQQTTRTFSHKILLYLREKYPKLYVLIIIRIYWKIIISWNLMTTDFIHMYHCFRGICCHHLHGNKVGVPHWWRRQQLLQNPLVHGYHITWRHIPEYCNLDVVAFYCTIEETCWCQCLPTTVIGVRGGCNSTTVWNTISHQRSNYHVPGCGWYGVIIAEL